MDKEAIEIQAQYVGELPNGYDWKLFCIGDVVQVVGINPDKEPIAYTIKNGKLELVEVTKII
jgi:hypothetical protein